jgi:Helicase conserved C-terminal domain
VAVPESRGTATIWRFTPDSVRGALDDGWSADELRAELAAATDRPLPQPLDYLIGDVARRHGSVRVRGVRSCVTGAEAEISEILHTRSLRRLQLSRLAPTVLASPLEADDLLPKLRAAGFAPMPEDADGVVTVPPTGNRSAPSSRTARTRPRVTPGDLADRLLAAGSFTAPVSKTEAELASLAPQLDGAEVALLADALESGRDVKIVYRNKDGNRTVRDIRPQVQYGRWLSSWCHLRSAEREFAVAGIESVAPVG